MNAHDIELPPLPKPAICEREVALYSAYAGSQIVDYARAAIEADRKRRSEPVKVPSFVELKNLAVEYGIMAGPILQGSRHAHLNESERFDAFIHALRTRYFVARQSN